MSKVLVYQCSFFFLFQYLLSFLHSPKGGDIIIFNSDHSILGKWLKTYLSMWMPILYSLKTLKWLING